MAIRSRVSRLRSLGAALRRERSSEARDGGTGAPVVAETPRDAYAAILELTRRYAGVDAVAGPASTTGSLTPYELRVFSQNGADGVIAELVRRAGAATRHFVEFGAAAGTENNCVFLADVLGWSGLFIEPDPELYGVLERKYAPNPSVRTLNERVVPGNVEALFERAAVPPEVDVLSIDVDGNDYWIWEAIRSFSPRIVAIEYNSSLDPQRRLVQPLDPSSTWDGTAFHGASLGALTALGAEKGYRLVHTDLAGVDCFFVRDDLGADLPAPTEVDRHGPNFLLAGLAHAPHTGGKRFIDLDEAR